MAKFVKKSMKRNLGTKDAPQIEETTFATAALTENDDVVKTIRTQIVEALNGALEEKWDRIAAKLEGYNAEITFSDLESFIKSIADGAVDGITGLSLARNRVADLRGWNEDSGPGDDELI